MKNLYKTVEIRLTKAKKWFLGKAALKVVKHLTPMLLHAISGAVAAHQLGFIEVIGGDIVIHTSEGLLAIVSAVFGGTLVVGVTANHNKCKKRWDAEAKAEYDEDATHPDMSGLGTDVN